MIIKGHSIHSARQCVGREGCSQDMAGSLCHMFLLTPSSALAWVLLRLQSLQGHLLFHEALRTSLPLVFLSDCLLCSIFYYLLNTLSQRCHQAWLVGSSVLWGESIAEPAGPSCFQNRTASDLFLQKPPLQFLHPLYKNFTTCTQYSRIWNLSLANNSHLLQYKLCSSWRLHLCGRIC